MTNTHSFTIRKFIKARRERVFEAWTNPELLKKWACPQHCRLLTSEGHAVVGGTYRTVMVDGNEIVTDYGVYKEVTPFSKLVFTSQWERSEIPPTLVTVEFHDKDGGTEVVLTQEGFIGSDYAKGHEQGWTSVLESLEDHAELILSDRFINTNQQPKFVKLSAKSYIGLTLEMNVHDHADNSKKIPQLWDRFSIQKSQIGSGTDELLGISSDIRQGGLADYTAAIVTDASEKIPSGMIGGTLPAGTYAQFVHEGPISSFSETVSYIHNHWMPNAGFPEHGCSQVEVYSKDADVMANNFKMKVLVPLF